MKILKGFLSISAMATMLILVSSVASLAASSASPASGANTGDPPYGLKVWGGASGDKLAGTVQISFFDLDCNIDTEGMYPCGVSQGYNQASARVSLLLSTTNANNKEDNTGLFYVDIGTITVHIYNLPETIQEIITDELENDILDYFGLGTIDEKAIYLKSFEKYKAADLICGDDSTDNTCYFDDEPLGKRPFSIMAEIILAVDEPGKEATK